MFVCIIYIYTYTHAWLSELIGFVGFRVRALDIAIASQLLNFGPRRLHLKP